MLRNIYQKAINDKFGYDLTLAIYYGEVGVGTSKPKKYSNCSSFANECQSITLKSCQSYIAKKEIGKNHEFVDTILAALFLNDDSMEKFFTKYPQNGYDIKHTQSDESNDELNVFGIVSPLICGFKSFTDIIKPYRISSDGDPNINTRGFKRDVYLTELKEFFEKTDPLSITDYYISQYVSGGGDPNPGNIGFAKDYRESQYEYVIAKVDLDASFKDYSQISGSKPTLETNLYAFTISDSIKDFSQFYVHVSKDGNILMPGIYSCEGKQYSCQWSGQGNVGLYNGQYKKSNAYGVNMGNYVKKQHLQDSLTKLCNIDKNEVISIFKSSADKIYELLYNSQEKDIIPLVKEREEMFEQYIDGRSNFISDRYDHLCSFLTTEETSSEDSDKDTLSYPWYHPHHPNFGTVAFAAVAAAVVVVCGCCYKFYSVPHEHTE